MDKVYEIAKEVQDDSISAKIINLFSGLGAGIRNLMKNIKKS